MGRVILILAAILIPPAILASPRSYAGYQVFRVNAQNRKQLDVLVSLREQYEVEPSGLINFWTEPAIHGNTDIMVAKTVLKEVQDVLRVNSIPYNLWIEDVEGLIQNQLEHNQSAAEGRMDWSAYHRYSAIMLWLEELASNYQIATTESIGATYEGRDIKLIKISTGGGPNKPVIFIDGCFHAREWISPAVVTYIVNQLVTNSSAYSEILDRFNFNVVPVVNADGYEWTHVSDRMWRKTRSIQNGTTCRGTDPNRNFDIDFGGSGSSANPCSDTFMGPNPFSETETQAVSRYLMANGQNIKAYLTMHSYSQAWLTPYAWSASPPPNFNDIMQVGRKAIEALRSVYGTEYVVGPTSTTLYFHSGAAQDWGKDVAGIKYTYTPELRDTGRYGFLLPPDQIIPTSIETWAAVQALAKEIIAIDNP